MSETLWEARADAMTLARPVAGQPPGTVHSLVYDGTDEGTLRVSYVVLSPEGAILETVAVVNEFVPSSDLLFVWPAGGPDIYVDEAVDEYVGARVTTTSTGIEGSHPIDRLVYVTVSNLPPGLDLGHDGYLRGTATSIFAPSYVQVTVHDTLSGDILATHDLPIEVKLTPGT